MDTYQPVYDAVRSKISSCDVGHTIESAIQNLNIGFYFERATNMMVDIAYEYARPSTKMKPTISLDGDTYIALYGNNIQEGVCGCGSSPDKAMLDFDKNWVKEFEKKIK
jgi:hypothetical protein